MEILTAVAKEAAKALFSSLKTRSTEHEDQALGSMEDGIRFHLKEVLSWSERIQFYEMNRGKETDRSSIALKVNTIPRKFRGSGEGIVLRETTLLQRAENHLLLGDPGAGKTTVIKRLVRRVLLEESRNNADAWQYPIVVRLREVDEENLGAFIARILRVKFEIKEKRKTRIVKDNRGKPKTISFTVREYTVGGRPLIDELADLLDSSHCILFLDGLDEVDNLRREEFEKWIEGFGGKTRVAKVIVSCRSGDYHRILRGFEVLEICPLEPHDIKTITKKWIGRKNQDEFLQKLLSLPFGDLASRPLFLCQLITLFTNTGSLPERPASVYKRIIRLVLEEWDFRRKVRRVSQYALFDSDRKMEFLAAIAYRLTYKLSATRFSTSMLVEAYSDCHRSFALPSSEATQVAKEIESHTGLIVESGDDYFEFSHLSLQEYLCADFLVRQPFSRLMTAYLAQRPAPVAVAASLAADSSIWLAALLLRDSPVNFEQVNFSAFLSRLVQERASFSRSVYLGFALMKVLFESEAQGIEEYFLELLGDREVFKSFELVWNWYEVSKAEQGMELRLRKEKFHNRPDFDFILPSEGNLEFGLHKLLDGTAREQRDGI